MSLFFNHSALKIFIVCSLGFFIPISSHAGIFTLLKGLSKAGKKADVDNASAINKLDVNGVPINKFDFDLPENQQAFVVQAATDSNGNWHFKSVDNTPLTASDAYAGFSQSITKAQKAVLVVDKYKLPSSLDKFDNLPDDVPVYIKDGDSLFELTKKDVWRIGENNISLAINSLPDLKKSLWHLQRPWSSKPVNVISLKNSGSSKTKQLNNNVSSYEVHIQDLETDLKKFRYQTVLIPSNITGDSISIAGKNSNVVSIQKLKAIAEKNDINLVILDAPNSSAAKKVTRHIQERYSSNLAYYNTNDFFQQLLNKNREIDIEIHPSGQSQTLIETKFTEPFSDDVVLSKEATVGIEDFAHISIDALIRSIQIIRPNEERSKELDSRIFPGVPSNVTFYLIISFISGLVCLSFSFMVWSKVWFLKPKQDYSNSFIYYCLWLLHRLCFVLLFLPLAGSFCLTAYIFIVIYKIIKAILIFIYRIIEFLIIKPIKYILQI